MTRILSISTSLITGRRSGLVGPAMLFLTIRSTRSRLAQRSTRSISGSVILMSMRMLVREIMVRLMVGMILILLNDDSRWYL